MRTRRESMAAIGLLSCIALTACGGDDDRPTGSAGSGAGAGGSSAGNGGPGASGTGGGSGSTSTAGSGGASGGGAGGGGSSGGSGAGGSAGGSSGDGGSRDSGPMTPEGDAGEPMSQATVCKAPVTAATSGNDCPAGPPVALELQLVEDGLDTPVFVTAAPGDTDRLFVVERGGRISILDRDDFNQIGDFMTVQNVDASTGTGEKGLLGLAFHPDYPDDPRFFVNFTRTEAAGLETAIMQYEVMADDPDKGDPDSEQLLINYGQPQANHNGGMIVFGPDGCLYIGAGDGGNQNDMGDGHAAGGNGQSLDTELGKLLRLDVDDPNGAAPGNLQGAGIPYIWDYGLRNPWRFSFDRQTGDLYIGDVGQGAWEEVDVEPKGAGNLNYGWPIMEGNDCLSGGCTPPGDLVGPVDEYAHGNGDDCVVGGYVYRGSDIPSLQGFYVYGDNGGGRKIRAFTWDGDGRCNDETILISERDGITLTQDITSFGEDAQGELYLTTMDSVFKIVAQ